MNFQTVGPSCPHPSGSIYTVIRDSPFEWIPAETIMSHIKGYIIENETPETPFQSAPTIIPDLHCVRF